MARTEHDLLDEQSDRPAEPAQRRADPEPTTEVDIGDDDDDADDADDAPSPQQPSARKQKKAERGARYRDLQRRHDEAVAARAAAEQRALEYQQFMLHQRDQASRAPEADPADKEIDDTIAEMARNYDQYQRLQAAGKLTPEDLEQYRKIQLGLERKKLDLATAKQIRAMQAHQPPQRQLSDVDIYVRSQYPDLVANAQASQWGLAELRKRVIRNGGMLTKELIDDVAQETRAEFGLGGAPRSQARSSTGRYVGHSAGPSAGPRAAPVRTVQVSKNDKKMALAMYDHLNISDEEKVKMWAKGPGKRAAEKRTA